MVNMNISREWEGWMSLKMQIIEEFSRTIDLNNFLLFDCLLKSIFEVL